MPLKLKPSQKHRLQNLSLTPIKTDIFLSPFPAGWAKQSGYVNSDSVLFMAQPLSKTCSFQINMTRMQLDFPAASLDSATKDI